jgi:hypothetical protein
MLGRGLYLGESGGKMTTSSAVAAKLQIAAAASVLVAAAALPAVAEATPAVPLPAQTGGEGLVLDCPLNPLDCLPIGGAPVQNSAFWFGEANPDFEPLIGIVFPNFFGFNFEFCVLGAAIHFAPYGNGFIGLGAGC